MVFKIYSNEGRRIADVPMNISKSYIQIGVSYALSLKLILYLILIWQTGDVLMKK